MRSNDATAPPSLSRVGVYALWGSLVLYSVALLWSLGCLPLLGPDEPRYAEVAREMYNTGDYISPRLCGLLWFEKPALFYWLAASAYHVFGANEFAARLPSALVSVATIGFMAYALRRAGLGRLGWLSALILATSALWFGFSHAATTDMVLSATISCACLAAFLATTSEGRTRLAWLLLSAALTGGAMLAKGLIGVFLVVVCLGLFSFLTRRRLFRGWRELLGAALLFLLVCGVWYGPVTLRHGATFIQEFFVNQHFKRYLTNRYQHPQPIYYYLVVTFGGMLPWSFFLLPAVGRLRRLEGLKRWRTDWNVSGATLDTRLDPTVAVTAAANRDALLVLAWLWFLVPFVFFSFSTSKLPGYILPGFPGLAIILAVEAEQLWQGHANRLLRIAATLNALTLGLIALGAALYIERKDLLPPALVMALLVVPCLVALASVATLLRGQIRSAVYGPAGAMLIVMLVAPFALLRPTGSLLQEKRFAVQVAATLKPDEDIFFYRQQRRYAHVFYSNGRVAFFDGGHVLQNMSTGDDLDISDRNELATALRSELAQGSSSIVLVTFDKWRAGLAHDHRFAFQALARQGDAIALRARLQPRVSSHCFQI